MTVHYEVVRSFRDHDDQIVVATGLTLREAQDHCNDPEASSTTASSPEGLKRTAQCGPWFEGFREEAEPEERL